MCFLNNREDSTSPYQMTCLACLVSFIYHVYKYCALLNTPNMMYIYMDLFLLIWKCLVLWLQSFLAHAFVMFIHVLCLYFCWQKLHWLCFIQSTTMTTFVISLTGSLTHVGIIKLLLCVCACVCPYEVLSQKWLGRIQ